MNIKQFNFFLIFLIILFKILIFIYNLNIIIETYSRLEAYNYIILLYNGSSAQREEQVEKE